MSFSSRLSLRMKLVGMVMGIIALLGASSLFSMNQIKHRYQEQVFDSFKQASTSLSEKIMAQFFERYADVQVIAKNPALRNTNPAIVAASLNELSDTYGIYDLIVVVDAKGHFVGSNSKNLNGDLTATKKLEETDFSSAPWFKSVMNHELTEAPSQNIKGSFVENPHVDPTAKIAFGKDMALMGFSAPIKDAEGHIVGVVTTRSIGWLEEEIKSVFENLASTGLEQAELTVVDKDGLILLTMNPSANNGKKELTYDFEKLNFKTNIKQLLDTQITTKILAGEDGAELAQNLRDDQSDVTGFERLKSKKWISSLGWSVILQEEQAELLASVQTALRNFYWVFGMCVFIAVTAAVFFGLAISKTISSMTQILAQNSNEVAQASSQIAAGSTQLSAASTEQAAALQETVAAVDEISAMVDKNAEAANQSREASGQSREAAQKGRETVDHMIQAISEIDSSNAEVSKQMELSNQQLTEITKLIVDIGTKTKVINEIVFQTKLLSFNASVEAARAGEAGKGFAVVAEEVGNLAQMSGNAAAEITSLLDESVRKVEVIVSESKKRVEGLMLSAREKVQRGSETANECNSALEEILTNIATVDELVGQIATASQEQSVGIREISKAVGQMDEVTQQNQSAAESSSMASQHLKQQSEDLKAVIQDLALLVEGKVRSSSSVVEKSYAATPVRMPNKKEELHAKARPEKQKTDQIKKPAKAPLAKVVPLKAKNKKPTPAPTTDDSLKQVSGSDVMPSGNDPGFQE